MECTVKTLKIVRFRNRYKDISMLGAETIRFDEELWEQQEDLPRHAQQGVYFPQFSLKI